VTAFTFGFALLLTAAKPSPEQFGWLTDYAAAKAAAAKSGKPILLVYRCDP
jgi:hypothetical protein